jgi:hypothetical protein
MFAHRSYKQKLKWLGAAAALSLLLCYSLAFRKTLREYSKYAAYARTGEDQDMGGVSLQELNERADKANILYSRYVLDTLQPDKNLLSVASNYCKLNNLQLKEYRPVNLYRSDNAQVLTRTVTVEGPFSGCLKFLYLLETTKSTGRVCSADFRSYTDPRDKRIILDCIIYVQNLIPIP